MNALLSSRIKTRSVCFCTDCMTLSNDLRGHSIMEAKCPYCNTDAGGYLSLRDVDVHPIVYEVLEAGAELVR